MKYYSQNGEDFIIGSLFNKNKGVFIEVGCLDGVRFSNTLFLEQEGWGGYCIEAHQGFVGLISGNRPGCKVVNCAIGESDEGEVTFYANQRGSLSTLDKNMEGAFKKEYGKYFTGFEEQKVPMRTLTSIFKEYSIDHVDVLSIDIEGYEYSALQGLDFHLYKPEILIIECGGVSYKNKVSKFLSQHAYYPLYELGENVFYAHDEKYKEKIKNIKATIKLIHTKNPAVSGDHDRFLKVDINTSENVFSKIISKIKNLFYKVMYKLF